jgi:pSer/pThr/pTyr-binding forkhead associated (FHA) protein
MILCQNCLHHEMLGAMFCSECGAQLIYAKGVPTHTIRATSPLKMKETSLKGPPLPVAYTVPDALISLNLLNTGDILPLTGQEEFTLGRVSEGQPVVPDLDLTPYKAYEAGVSRMHVSIRTIEEQVLITDLGSANGTRVNGVQITPHIPYPVKHGDILTLGKFKIQILLRDQ